MSTQVVLSTPPTLGPFLKLILTLTLQCEAELAEHGRGLLAKRQTSSAAAANDPQQKTRAGSLRLYSCHDPRTVPDAVVDLAPRQFLD